ncbi:MAG: hypothetical protein JWP27_965 [Flaviaesturariibacter sp.]|nr:hypothetical protein [Flaviaesturariibacter sp.]
MFQPLTKYLLHYRHLSIPSIGSFTIEEEPARFDFGEKVILPPATRMVYHEAADLPEAQLGFLARELQVGADDVKNRLYAFGNGLRSSLQQEAVSWGGLGILQLEGNKVVLRPALIQLAPVPAQKVIRDDAMHVVRRGEDQVRSSFRQEEVTPVARTRTFVWIAWLLVVLAILFVAYWVYRQGSLLPATGLQYPAN